MTHQRFAILRPILEKTRRCFICRSSKDLIHRLRYSVCLACRRRTRFVPASIVRLEREEASR